MSANDFESRLKNLESDFPALTGELRHALAYAESDPSSSLTKSRIVMEKLLITIYTSEMGREPRKPMLGEMLNDNQFTRKVERRIVSRINSIRDLANLGPHGEHVLPTDAAKVLEDLCEVLSWHRVRYLRTCPQLYGERGLQLMPSLKSTPSSADWNKPRKPGPSLFVRALVITFVMCFIIGWMLGSHPEWDETLAKWTWEMGVYQIWLDIMAAIPGAKEGGIVGGLAGGSCLGCLGVCLIACARLAGWFSGDGEEEIKKFMFRYRVLGEQKQHKDSRLEVILHKVIYGVYDGKELTREGFIWVTKDGLDMIQSYRSSSLADSSYQYEILSAGGDKHMLAKYIVDKE